jgi:hypothetical protein
VLSEGTQRGIAFDTLSRVLSAGPARAFGHEPPTEAIEWDTTREWTVEGGPFDGVLVRGAVAG